MIQYELSEHEGFGRICVGDFPEYAAGLSDTQAGFLAAWWRQVVAQRGGTAQLWTCERQRRWRRSRMHPGLVPSGGATVSTWSNASWLNATEHRLVSIQAAAITPVAAREIWSTWTFGLLGPAAGVDINIDGLESLARTASPGVALLSQVDVLILPWHHRLWMDLYCARASVPTNVAFVRSAASSVNMTARQVVETYA